MNESKLSVSAVIITYNEENKIARCLESLVWADEIVVVDAYSTDRTREICTNPYASWFQKIQVFDQAWNGFKDQRNFAIQRAKYDWVLVMDADEVCTPELAQKIRSILNQPGGPERSAYKVHRKEFFMNKPIFYGMWNPSYQDRFFYRVGVKYVNDVHEYPVFLSTPGNIHESILHLSDLTVEKYMEKLNRYTSIEAQDRFRQGQRTNVFKLLFAFPAHAFKSFFYYQAYKDGVHGLVISLLEGVSRVVRQIKIWQIMQKNSK